MLTKKKTKIDGTITQTTGLTGCGCLFLIILALLILGALASGK
jgi:hypothetical protein